MIAGTKISGTSNAYMWTGKIQALIFASIFITTNHTLYFLGLD
jgi:hypothetical protein